MAERNIEWVDDNYNSLFKLFIDGKETAFIYRDDDEQCYPTISFTNDREPTRYPDDLMITATMGQWKGWVVAEALRREANNG